MTKHIISVRVEYDTLTELHKLTANSKTSSFADVAGDLLDRAAAPNTYLVVVPPHVAGLYRRAAWKNGETIEAMMLVVLATATAWQDAIDLEQAIASATE